MAYFSNHVQARCDLGPELQSYLIVEAAAHTAELYSWTGRRERLFGCLLDFKMKCGAFCCEVINPGKCWIRGGVADTVAARGGRGAGGAGEGHWSPRSGIFSAYPN